MKSHSDRYQDFGSLYNDVTQSFIAYIRDLLWKKQATQFQLEWFTRLVQRFEIQFNAWPTAQSEIKEYLELFHERPRSIQLAAHAFLHVALDLPRAIADSLAPIPRTGRTPYRRLFLRAAPLFREVFLNRTRRGQFGQIARPFGCFEPTEILCYWLFSLRSVAWIHGEVLADVSVGERAILEKNLPVGSSQPRKLH